MCGSARRAYARRGRRWGWGPSADKAMERHPREGLAVISLTLNGETRQVAFDSYKTLLEVLREDLNLPGTKHGCELGECGACAVLVDGTPTLSCLLLALECDGRDVVTVEGLLEDGRLHPLQDAFADLGGAQCGYCTPGLLVTAKALLERNPSPSAEQIREALAGNICRCTGYQQIVEAVQAAAAVMTPEDEAKASYHNQAKAWFHKNQAEAGSHKP
jgi:aerobic-type carbon monoxide dehydrogenase small subunit (CoxS/CutS family)